MSKLECPTGNSQQEPLTKARSHLPKTPQELGITDEVWVNLAEQLLASREILLYVSFGPLYELHKMQKEYLENLFGITKK